MRTENRSLRSARPQFAGLIALRQNREREREKKGKTDGKVALNGAAGKSCWECVGGLERERVTDERYVCTSQKDGDEASGNYIRQVSLESMPLVPPLA